MSNSDSWIVFLDRRINLNYISAYRTLAGASAQQLILELTLVGGVVHVADDAPTVLGWEKELDEHFSVQRSSDEVAADEAVDPEPTPAAQ